ncbi:MAG: cytochrome c-type biogenesis protein CcmH [Roseovarius sp.]
MRWLALTLALLFALPAHAVQPDEILDDPRLEERARELSKGLRCLVCRNESIDESNAELARDLRILVRERLVAGDTNEEVIDFVVARYGEYVLLRPQADGSNLLLWAAGPIMLILGVGIALVYVRRRAQTRPDTETQLSAEEQTRLDDILKG